MDKTDLLMPIAVELARLLVEAELLALAEEQKNEKTGAEGLFGDLTSAPAIATSGKQPGGTGNCNYGCIKSQ